MNLSIQLSDYVKEIDRVCMEAIRNGSKAAVLSMAGKARSILSSHTQASTPAFRSLLSGIRVSWPSVDTNGDTRVGFHAMGSRSSNNSFKTRFFVGGTAHRFNVQRKGNGTLPSLILKKPRFTGSIIGCDAINRAASLELLKEMVLSEINKNKK